ETFEQQRLRILCCDHSAWRSSSEWGRRCHRCVESRSRDRAMAGYISPLATRARGDADTANLPIPRVRVDGSSHLAGVRTRNREWLVGPRAPALRIQTGLSDRDS